MVYKSTKKAKNILYPIFLECSELCADESWKQLYIDFANNKCQKNIYISKGCITSAGKKDQYFSYSFVDKTAEQIVLELYPIYSKYTSFCSIKDLKKIQSEISELTKKKEVKYSSWKSIKKKAIKAQLIDEYVIRMKKKYSLSSTESLELQSLINNGLLFQSQTSDDIVFEDGEIKSIKGIKYDKDAKKFINTHSIKQTKDLSEKDIDNCLYYYWPKVVTAYHQQNKECVKTISTY